ncbi:DUF2911 domain-containing protein [Bergeyella sp. RCAD1439]|uniref:DUF2911 domain-containing protein n=1 Tax=Bergeyella anatis TaxID=3113737 RepID=UPI002E17DD89|nr:DUF2911 domain-containing protein [Bergeyella sp. RCAD1439]
MKKIMVALALGAFLWGQAQYVLPAASPRVKTEQQFSISKIIVDYGRPGVKGRTVFGGLVPYGKVWRAGANASTKITFGQAVDFGGQEVSAGTYGLFIIPEEKEWTLVLNKDFQQWGAYAYDEKQDVVRVKVPVRRLDALQEWFTIEVEPSGEHAVELVMAWERSSVGVSVKASGQPSVDRIVDKLKEIRQIEREKK